ncbi:MAG TPA: sensor histidine kinase [Bryobacteraceae bacterium]|nr:sensor histidine kinase [Bryobacteraceae bacterium]
MTGTTVLRYSGWGRVVLAAVALAVNLALKSPLLLSAAIAVFLIVALVMAFRSRGLRGISGLLVLFADLVFFLALANAPGAAMWIAPAAFVYLLGETLAFYAPLELTVIVGICAVFCGAISKPPTRALEPVVITTGVLAIGCALAQQRQKRETDGLSHRLADAENSAAKAREEERQRIASDFHDGPLQSFISLQMRLEIVRKLLDRDAQAGLQDLKDLQVLAQTQVRDLRTFLHSMRPVDVDGGNFVAVVRRLTETFQKESSIPVTFQGEKTPVGLPRETTLEVLQMLRESLHNVQKHAGATRVAVSLEKTDKGLEISVDDNGHGFPFAGSYSLEELELLRLGPASLKRRARALNAELLLESRPGRGASLKYRVPLA